MRGQKFVRTSQLLLFFSAVPRIAVKLIFKKENGQKHRCRIDVFWVFQSEHGYVTVLLLSMIVLFSSGRRLYSRRLQEGSRVRH